MKKGIPTIIALMLGTTLVLGIGLYAQVKKDEKTGLDRIEGRVQAINKEKSTLSIQQSGGGVSGGKAVWQVSYTDQTKFSYRNTPAKLEDVKDGLRVIVLGKLENMVMKATRVDIRTEK